MYDIETQLKDLQKEIGKYEAEIASVQETFQDAQKKISVANRHRGELASIIVALKSENDELLATRSAISNGRKAAEADINDAKKVIQDAADQLKEKAPKKLSKAVTSAVKSVDDEIGDKKSALDELRNKLSEAEKTLAEAQKLALLHEKATGESKTLLKNLTGQIKAAQGQVATLKHATETATKNKSATEALYLLGELKEAVGEFEKLVDPKREEELVKQRLNHQQKATAAEEEVGKKTGERDQLRQDLTAAERDYQTKTKWRERAIKTKLAALSDDSEPQPDAVGAD